MRRRTGAAKRARLQVDVLSRRSHGGSGQGGYGQRQLSREALPGTHLEWVKRGDASNAFNQPDRWGRGTSSTLGHISPGQIYRGWWDALSVTGS
jgi:hypothetical protein